MEGPNDEPTKTCFAICFLETENERQEEKKTNTHQKLRAKKKHERNKPWICEQANRIMLCSSFLWGAKAVREFIGLCALYERKKNAPFAFTSFFDLMGMCLQYFSYHQIKTRLFFFSIFIFPVQFFLLLFIIFRLALGRFICVVVNQWIIIYYEPSSF